MLPLSKDTHSLDHCTLQVFSVLMWCLSYIRLADIMIPIFHLYWKLAMMRAQKFDRLLYMDLVFVLSLADLYSSLLLEVRYTCPVVGFRGLIHTLQLSNSCFLFNRGSVKIKCCDTAAKCSAI